MANNVARIATIEQTLSEIKEEQKQTKHELGETKHELAGTKHELAETKQHLRRTNEVRKKMFIANLLCDFVRKAAKVKAWPGGPDNDAGSSRGHDTTNVQKMARSVTEERLKEIGLGAKYKDALENINSVCMLRTPRKILTLNSMPSESRLAMKPPTRAPASSPYSSHHPTTKTHMTIISGAAFSNSRMARRLRRWWPSLMLQLRMGKHRLERSSHEFTY